jgi:transcriptional regulator EpsA
LHAAELEWLARALEVAAEVRRRPQFFLWAQGELQSLLPHGILFCGYMDPANRSYAFDVFSGTPVPDDAFAACFDAGSGLLPRLIRAWEQGGGSPLLLSGGLDGAIFEEFRDDLREHALDNLAAHGLHDVNGFTSTFFAFCRVPQALDPKFRYTLDLVAPHLHRAFTHVVFAQRRDDNAIHLDGRVLSSREAEILRWVQEGKSNFEIGQQLDISPLTVKNHIQKILRKLKVQNRAQAVARAISNKIIDASRSM